MVALWRGAGAAAAADASNLPPAVSRRCIAEASCAK